MNLVILVGRLFALLFFLSTCVYVSGQSAVDLEVTVQPPSNTVRGGESFSYAATVRNIGSITATNVRLFNASSENLEITSVSTSAGSCPDSTPVRSSGVTCMIGDIEPNGTVSLTFTASIVYLDDSGNKGQAPIPMTNDWSQEVATISVDVVHADPNRSNNVARVKVDVEPRSNGLPLVRILFPREISEIARQSEIAVKIQAYDTDGSIDRVVVTEPKYMPLPFVEDGAYKFIYIGKKFTAAQLTAYVKANPPPVLLARRTGKDTFEYTILNPALGPNQVYVEVFDKQGRTNYTSIVFFVQ